MAAEYLNSVILGRIQQAKCRMLAEGRWVGGGIPIGFMVDRRKVLADGNRNPEYSRYVPFEPYMGIVHQYFQICIACDYRIRPMTHEIIRNGPYLPDPNVWKPPPGYITRYMLSNPIEGKGYALCVATLRYLLTDVAYIGHWVLRGSIVRWNNHPAIVPTDLFMDVFNHLSHTTLEGGQNLEVQENSVRRRSDPKEAQSADLPLLAGKIYSYHQDKWLLANTHYRASDHYYIYSVWAPFPDEEVLWVKSAKVIDQRIIQLFLDKLSAAREQGNWDRMIKTFRAFGQHEELQEKTKRIQSLSRGIRNLIESLETLSNREMIKEVQTRYEKLQAEWERLTEEVRDLQKQDELFQKAIERLNDPEQGMVSAWAQLSTEQKQTILGLGVKRIEVEKIEENALHLTIHWADHGSEDFSMPRMAGQWNSWLPSDRRRLLDLVERKSTKQEILAAFPDIRWKSIMHEIYYLHGRVCIENNIQLRGGETYRKYLLRTQEERGRENEKRS